MPATEVPVHADRIEAVLGRPPWTHTELPLPIFSSSDRILVTGSGGFLGRRLRDSPAVRQLEVGSLDLEDGCDVLNETYVRDVFARFEPTIVFHLAAHKDAPAGEEIPGTVADLNVRGTEIVCAAARDRSIETQRAVRVVLASTCKAADPATAYGASKLIAERIVLNTVGGRAMRLVNVAASSRSVLQMWERLSLAGEPLPVASSCVRAFVTPDEAVRLLLNAATLPCGVYGPRARFLKLHEIANAAYPDDPVVEIPPRWGDRLEERLAGGVEWIRATDIPAIVAIEPEWRDGADDHAIALLPLIGER